MSLEDAASIATILSLGLSLYVAAKVGEISLAVSNSQLNTSANNNQVQGSSHQQQTQSGSANKQVGGSISVNKNQ